MSAPASRVWGLGFTKLSKGLGAVLVAGYATALVFPIVVDYLSLVPGKTIPFTWNLITAGYFEYSLAGILVSLAGLLFFGKLLEPVWGSKEFFKFIAVVSFFSSVSTFVVSIFLYYVTGHENLLYTPIAGFHGVLAGFLVAVKQIFPDYELFRLQVVHLRAKYLPGLFVKTVLLVAIFLEDPIIYVPFILFGTYGSWLYLRYFQSRSESNVKGDASVEFGFRTFFPEFLWPVITPVTTLFEKLCCGQRAQSLEDQGEDLVSRGNPLPGSDAIEASRRRERGARALEERLNAATKASDVEALGSKGSEVSLEVFAAKDSV